MAQINDWLTIDRLNGRGNSTITLTASELTEIGERNVSLKIKTNTKQVLLNLMQIDTNADFFCYDKDLISSEWSGCTKTFQVCTNHEDLYFSNVPEWITISNTRNGFIHTYTITFSANSSNSIRFAKLQPRVSGHNYLHESIILVQGIESEENRVMYYKATSDTTPYNQVGIVETKYYSQYGIHSLLYNKPIEDVVDNLFYDIDIYSITFPPSVRTIGNKAFYQSAIQSIDWFDNITSIGEESFYANNHATWIPSYISNSPILKLPSSLQTIGNYAFSSFIPYRIFILPDGLLNIGVSGFSNTPIRECVIPNGITKIENHTFNKCRSLKTIIIPDSVTEIGNFAFEGCESLNTIKCEAITAPTLYNKTFYNIGSNGTLYYPSGSDYSTWLNYLSEYNWTGVPY